MIEINSVLVVENAFLLGTPYGKKGWRLYDLENKEFFVSRDVMFYENIFPFAESEAPTHDVALPESRILYSDSLPNTYAGEDASQGATNNSHLETTSSSSISPSTDNVASTDDCDERGSDIVNDTNDTGYATNDSQENTGGSRRSSRERQPSVL